MARIVHFDLSAENVERAIGFYEGVFGWKFTKWDGPFDYWLVSTGPKEEPGIDGGLSPRGDSNEGVMNTIEVPSVDETLEQIARAGGQVTQPKAPIPGVGYFASCQDTEGNAFGVMESDPQAK